MKIKYEDYLKLVEVYETLGELREKEIYEISCNVGEEMPEVEWRDMLDEIEAQTGFLLNTLQRNEEIENEH